MDDNNLPKFKKLLRFVYKNKLSDFYRAKYGKAGFNPPADFRSMNDVEKIPLLSKKELSQKTAGEILFVPEKDILCIAASSGTTGEPMLFFHSKPEKPGVFRLHGAPFGRIMFLRNSFRAGRDVLRAHELEHASLVGDIHDLSTSCRLAEKAGIETIVTIPTLAIILKDYLKKYPNLEKSLKFFRLSGETVSPVKKNFLKKLFPGVEIFFHYGSAETSRRAYQCRYLARKDGPVFYHPLLADFHFELIDQETGQPTKFGEKGELVLTDFWNRATPLIRYKTGDSASFHKNNCPCGAPGPLLQVWGRINRDSVRAGGLEIRKDMLEKPLINLRDHIKEDFEAHIYESFVNTKPKIKIILNLSLKEGVEESLWLKKTITEEFLKNCQLSPRLNLKMAVEAGLFYRPEINFVVFPRSAKTKGALILH
ncbi:MAG: AMP-binding protein [Candidatus Portnoybacteria bacterium]|nr:AMP-binding protein [Candidatus Portnoybacteria bacterium]MDD4982874.1 AMP-binding protein [Candidatus Portnoybacteria bacterium]